MKAIRNILNKVKPNFEKGGKLYFLHSTFDAFETFFFVPDTITKQGSHIRDSIDSKRTMIMVVVALMPAFLFGCWNIGRLHFLTIGQAEFELFDAFWFGFLKILPLLTVSYVTSLSIEFGAAQIRGHEVNEGVLVTGFLIPLIVPVDVPLWMVAVATAFAIVFGKEVFGGTGMNIVNPALLTRAFLFFAYPAKMSGDKIWAPGIDGATTQNGVLMTSGGEKIIDATTGATPLGNAAPLADIRLPYENETIAQHANEIIDGLPSISEMFIGTIPGSIGETSTLAILIGAIILLWTGIGSWKIMLSVFGGGLATAALLNAVGTNAYMDLYTYEHLLIGGFAFGAVFMATDPVSAAQTERGKWIYGVLIGVLAIIVRLLNPGFPEGMMLAILLMNVFAPLIDHYVIQGHVKRRLKRQKKAIAQT